MGGIAGNIFKPGGLTRHARKSRRTPSTTPAASSWDQARGPPQPESAGRLARCAGRGTSPAAGMAGLMLGMNGVQRQGVGGTIEAGLGGALAGFSPWLADRFARWSDGRGDRRWCRCHSPESISSVFFEVSAEESARRHQEHLRREHPAEQRHDQAGGPDRAVAVRRRCRGGRAVAERPSTRDAVLGGHRPEDAAVGHDAVRGEPGGAGRQALSTSQLPGWPGSRLRLEHPDARRDRVGNLSDAGRPEHGRRQRRDVHVAEHQRQPTPRTS